MANLNFPLQINSLRFYVNPRNLKVTKPLSFSPLPTQGGVQYQVWYDAPEILTISGASAGSTAYQELLLFRQQYERTDKLATIFYKTKIYQGFITSMDIEASTEHLNEFTYTINYQLLFGQSFGIEDFSITTETQGAVEAAIGRLQNIVNIPLNNVTTKVDTFLKKI